MVSNWRLEGNEVAFIAAALQYYIQTTGKTELSEIETNYGQDISAKEMLAMLDRFELAALRMKHNKK